MKVGAKGALHIGRFERRIVFAISIAAIVPLVTSLVLGLVGFRETVTLGLNPRIRDALDRAVASHAALGDALRDRAELAATVVASDAEIDGLLARGDDASLEAHLGSIVDASDVVVSVEVWRGARGDGGGGVAWRSSDHDEAEILVLERTTAGGNDVAVGTVGPSDLAFNLLRIGEVRSDLRTIAENADLLALTYLGVAAGLLLFVIVVAMAVAFLLSRRVTRRITLLADATERVGGGDLTVEVPIDERDEVGDLTRAFNAMVGDLRASRDRVEYLERVGAWQEMARRLAHEIKNPLTPIQLAVQQAHQSYRGDDPRFKKTLEDAREIVDEEVQTLRRLVSEFSEFARLPEPELVPLDLSDLARDAMRALDPIALRAKPSEKPAPTVGTELEARPVPVRADPQLLRRCLDNLVRNAVQAIDEQGGSAVVVAVRRDEGSAVLEVRDDGPGVPPDARERIFQPYFTTKELGTGLGLAIVKKAILEHGGSIECLAAPEGGACFRVRLPLALAALKDKA